MRSRRRADCGGHPPGLPPRHLLGGPPARRRLALPRRAPLDEHGLELLEPEVQAAHPLDDGTAAALHRGIEQTADALGRDGASYRRLFAGFARNWDELAEFVLAPPRPPTTVPLTAARFSALAVAPAAPFLHARFRTRRRAPSSPARRRTRCAR